MKSVLISIQPKWCELIAPGKKTVEVRKTKPKLETPFKVYIYETNWRDNTYWKNHHKGKLGKVIGEFVCDKIDEYPFCPYICEDGTEVPDLSGYEIPTVEGEKTGMDYGEASIYGNGNPLYFWHISDLVIYDKPRELSEFYAEGDCACMNCKNCAWFDRGNGYNVEDDCNLAYKGVDLHKSLKPILRPPQSWCYVVSEDTE